MCICVSQVSRGSAKPGCDRLSALLTASEIHLSRCNDVLSTRMSPQELQHTRIELRRFLEEEEVTGVGKGIEPCRRDRLGKLAHRRPGAMIVTASEQEQRELRREESSEVRLQLTELGQHQADVDVAVELCELLEEKEQLGMTLRESVLPSQHRRQIQVILCRHERLRSLRIRRHRDQATCSTRERERADTLRLTRRKSNRRKAAHRLAEEMRLIDLQMVEQSDQIVGELARSFAA